MLKTLTIILSFYIFYLNAFVHCDDHLIGFEINDHSWTEALSEAAHPEHHEHGIDLCSVFCMCNVASVIPVEISFSISEFSINIQKIPYCSYYRTLYSSYHHIPWTPPKIA